MRPADPGGGGPVYGKATPAVIALKYPQKMQRITGVYIWVVYNACCHDKATETSRQGI